MALHSLWATAIHHCSNAGKMGPKGYADIAAFTSKAQQTAPKAHIIGTIAKFALTYLPATG